MIIISEYVLVPGATPPEGYKPLTSSWQDCRDAAISLGFHGDSVAHVDYKFPFGADRPQGCFRSTGNNRFHFNTGVGGGFQGTDQILCVRKGKEVHINTGNPDFWSMYLLSSLH